MSSTSILVTGAQGQLGSEFRELQKKFAGYHFVFVSKEELDITDEAAIRSLFDQHPFNYCINCAAYTAVDKAETDQEAAMAINGLATGYLATVAAEKQIKFVHFSTDYVFPGTATEPISTDESTSPLNYYGETKLAGEKLAMENNIHSIVIRTSWVYSSFGKNFVKTMMRLMSEKEEIRVVADQFGSPTYAADLAMATMQIIGSGKFVPGIYHYSNKGIISWYNFAVAIGENIKSSCIVIPIGTSDFPTPAPRPAYSAMDTSKIENTYGIEIPYWRDSLEKCVALINA